ncbi:MAG: glycoside hydrolase family 88 protein [Eubacteriales bacterium]|nr:glycoside hydrolase family 88 protein [Eubacteriales bacterium]MDD3881057.1 glycoside hydrolase family 88 protein [Eubacteriales bacterium]MDD4511874.1 glycoside hydrolase family 88 protein [Eubacteriales bacterium]
MEWYDEAFLCAERKYLNTYKSAEQRGIIPYRGKGGEWLAPPYDGNSWWTCGFYPALLLQLYKGGGDKRLLSEARRTEGLLQAELTRFSCLNHDVGFMYLLSAGADYKLFGGESSKTATLHAANLLAGRFNPCGFIRAWNGDKSGWAIVDSLMNLPLLYWASEVTGDPRFRKIACIHADTALRAFVRDDGSCNHIVIFDSETGEALDAPAGQGCAKGSSWSRGQAWALYGFTLSYIATGFERYLAAAEKIADYFISNIREDGLTLCDFRQPKDEELFDNIAGACAACGLMELKKHSKSGAEKYESAADKMLLAIWEKCCDRSESVCGLTQKCTAAYNDDGAGRNTNILYGDYFFIEAICKKRGTDIMPWTRS